MTHPPTRSLARFTTRRLLLLAIGVPLSVPVPAEAEISSTGSVSPNPLFVTAQDDLFVGQTSGGLGTLDITNGSFLVSRNGFINGTGSRVTVTGAGSAWLMFGDLRVGFARDSSLHILDGGAVTNQSVFMGASNPANFGTVLVDGAGSAWNIHGNLNLGSAQLSGSSDGFVSIANGAVVNVDGHTFSSPHPANTSNLHFDGGTLNTHSGLVPLHALSGTGTINADHWLLTGDFSLSSPGDLPTALTVNERAGQNIDVGLAWATPMDQLEVFGIDHGTLTMQGGMQVTSRDGHINYSDGPLAGVMNIDGPGTTWTIDREFYIGNRGVGELNITGGGAVVLSGVESQSFHRFYIGYNTGGVGRITVDGVGSALNTLGSGLQLDLGYEGEGHLVIRNGATANLHGIDLFQGSVLIDGAGTSVDTTSVNIGPRGVSGPDDPPQFVLSGGADLQSNGGYFSGLDETTVFGLVDGIGTAWTIDSTLRIGNRGQGVLDVTGGAALESGDAIIGFDNNGDTASRLNLSGAGTNWTNHGNVTLGDEGLGVLSIADGATADIGGTLAFDIDLSRRYGSYVELDNGTLTVADGFLNARNVLGVGTVNTNTFLLEGTHTLTGFADLPGTIQVATQPGQNLTVNPRWDANPTVSFEVFGADGGDITMSGGFNLRTFNGYVGYTEGSEGRMTLTGTGTRWRSGLTIGQYGSGTMRVENGAVYETDGGVTLGDAPGASGELVVTGPGSQIDSPNGFILEIGRHGTGSVLIEAGASVNSDTVYLGRFDDASGELTVTGAGTVWTSERFLFIGGPDSTGVGTVNVTDGAQVFFSSTAVGSDTPMSGFLNIDGPGSRMEVDSSLSTGEADSGRIFITNGGELSSLLQTRINGEVLIDGAGSSWEIGDRLYVGDKAYGLLTLSDGGQLLSGESHIGYNQNSSGSAAEGDVLIDGAGTLWMVNGALRVGGDRFDRGNEGRGALTVSDGAVVDVAGALVVESSGAGSLVSLDNGTINLDSALLLNEQITGTGTVNADYWLINGTHTLSDFSSLPGQFVLDTMPGQDITVNLAWSDPAQTFDFFGVDTGDVQIGAALPIHSTTGYVAYNDGSAGALTFLGEGAAWQVDEELFVGYRGAGVLRVESGAQLNTFQTYLGDAGQSDGRLELAGVGSFARAERLVVGTGGVGALEVTGGARVLVESFTGAGNGTLIVGDAAGSSGSVTASGVGTQLDVLAARLTVGDEGAGAVTIRDGAALLTDNDTYVGWRYSGAGLVEIDGGSWTGEGLILGHDGTADVAFLNGASVTSRFVRLGSENETFVDGVEYVSRGTVWVDGAGTQWDIEFDLQVGRLGEGVLEITGGAVVNSRGAGIGNVTDRSGVVTVSGAGSSWNMTGNLALGGQPYGTLTVEDGGRVASDTMELRGQATVRGVGSTLYAATLIEVLPGGVLRVEEGGRIETPGSLSLGSGARLVYALDETNVASVEVDGSLDLGSFAELLLETTPGLAYTLGDQFTLVQVAEGTFGRFINAAENQTLDSRGGVDLLMTYMGGDGNDIVLRAALAGDLDGDQTVGAGDLDILLANWGEAVEPFDRAAGDLSGDGLVGQADLQIVTSHWGNNASNTGTVPEPVSATALLALFWVKRRRR